MTIEKKNRPKVPALLIGNATQALIEDVFERKNVFHGAQRISKRIVAWGNPGSTDAQPVEVPHAAVVISEQDLVDPLNPPESEAHDAAAAWTIFTSRPLPERVQDRHFGSRIAQASRGSIEKALRA